MTSQTETTISSDSTLPSTVFIRGLSSERNEDQSWEMGQAENSFGTRTLVSDDLKSERARLATFTEWNNPYVTAEALAFAGFFFLETTAKTQCYFCDGVIPDWKRDDNPAMRHQKEFPTCAFVLGHDVGNEAYIENNLAIYFDGRKFLKVSCDFAQASLDGDRIEFRGRIFAPMDFEELSSHNSASEISFAEKYGIVMLGKQPKYPNYAEFKNRLISFKKWPSQSGQSAITMSEAGFFYSEIRDITICFFCGLALCDWIRSDNPWDEHIAWAETCLFLTINKNTAKPDEINWNGCVGDFNEPLLGQPTDQAIDRRIGENGTTWDNNNVPYRTAEKILETPIVNQCTMRLGTRPLHSKIKNVMLDKISEIGESLSALLEDLLAAINNLAENKKSDTDNDSDSYIDTTEDDIPHDHLKNCFPSRYSGSSGSSTCSHESHPSEGKKELDKETATTTESPDVELTAEENDVCHTKAHADKFANDDANERNAENEVKYTERKEEYDEEDERTQIAADDDVDEGLEVEDDYDGNVQLQDKLRTMNKEDTSNQHYNPTVEDKLYAWESTRGGYAYTKDDDTGSNLEAEPWKTSRCKICNIYQANIVNLPCKHIEMCSQCILCTQSCFSCKKTISGVLRTKRF